MQKHDPRTYVIACILVVFVLLACSVGGYSIQQEQQPAGESGEGSSGQSGGEPPSSSGEPTAIVISPTQPPKILIDVPKPEAGKGNVVGRILWNSQPVVGADTKLCEEFEMFGGCQGQEFSTKTDDKGYYLFLNVPPGEYALAVRALDKDAWLFVTAGLFNAKKYKVTADETLEIGDQSIYKFDIKIASPADKAKVADAKPTLEWDAYSNAAYYEVYVTAEKGGAILINERTDTNKYTFANPLLACKYTWNVEAFNASNEKIAELDGYFDFHVIDQPVSCYVGLISPQDGASVSGQGLVLKWEEHPLAAYYEVHVWDADYNDILGSARVDNATEYTLSQTLKSGGYKWYITAFDQTGDDVAGSDFYEFSVP